MSRIAPSLRLHLSLALALLYVSASSVHAQDVEEVAQHTEEMPADAPESDETALNLSIGGALNTGNTQAFQLSNGGTFRLVRGMHALGADTVFIFGRAKLDTDDDGDLDEFQDTTRNLNTRIRYDYFLTTMNALFVAGVHRWDTFAGLDARIQGQAGYLRQFYKHGEVLRIWGEAGYDITYDNYTQEVLDEADDDSIDEESIVHSARLFFGYDNHVTDTFTVLLGVESLINMEKPEDFRINWDNALRSKINSDMQLEIKFSLKYDNREVPGTKRTDTTTQINLVYAFI